MYWIDSYDAGAAAMSGKRVVGIGFAPDASVPTVVLKGSGEEAQLLLQQAREQEIPVVADPKLLRDLYRVPVDATIGRELFPVMAALLAHVLKIDRAEIERERSR